MLRFDRRGMLATAVAATAAIAFGDRAFAQGRSQDAKAYLIGPFKVDFDDERVGPQKMTASFVIIASVKDIEIMMAREREISSVFLTRVRDMRVPDLQGASGQFRIKELVSEDVLRPLSLGYTAQDVIDRTSAAPRAKKFDFVEVLMTEMYFSRR